VPLSPSNSLLLIVTKLGQRVAQNPRIHCHMILNPRALLPNRWVFKLARLHGNIVTCLQMSHQVIFSCIGCITPINLIRKFRPIPYPMDTFYGNGGGTQSHLKSKNRNKKPNVRLNILDESYPLNNEGIA